MHRRIYFYEETDNQWIVDTDTVEVFNGDWEEAKKHANEKYNVLAFNASKRCIRIAKPEGWTY